METMGEFYKAIKEVLAFQIDSYLFENEDIGYSKMWMNEQDYNEACIHDEK